MVNYAGFKIATDAMKYSGAFLDGESCSWRKDYYVPEERDYYKRKVDKTENTQGVCFC